jgi:excinuclease UvrABC nuclease subunit
MDIASANMEFEKAAELRDMILELKKGKKLYPPTQIRPPKKFER